MTSDTTMYLNALFGNKPEAAKSYIWAKRGPAKESPTHTLWCDDAAHMIRAVQSLESEPGWDIYAGIATAAKKGRTNQRVGKDSVYTLPALYVDIDYGGIGHKNAKDNLPKDEAAAIALVDAMGVPASMIVNSGGGIHAYWLFVEHWLFDTPEERERARLLSTSWQRWIQVLAGKAGVAVDSTFDLARVLRVPGTINNKTEELRQARIVRDTGKRYQPSDLEAAIPGEAKQAAEVKVRTAKAAAASTIAATFTLSAAAMPPADKYMALCAAEPRFDLATKYQRKDLKDQSPSGYDLAMANFSAIYGWSDQEIVDLLITVRRNQRQDMKLDRADYYARTLNLCRSHVMKSNAVQELTAQTAAKRIEAVTSDKPAAAITPDERGKSLDFVSKCIGVRIRQVLKYMQDPPRYRVETNNGGIDLGTVENLIGQTQMRNALAAVENTLLSKFKNDEWEAIAQALLSSAEPINTGPESTDKGAIKEWLIVYLDENRPATKASEQSLANQNPHYEEHFVCIFLPHFRNWLFQRQGERMSGKQLGILLRFVNAEPGQVAVEVEVDDGSGGKVQKRTTRAIWRLPRGKGGAKK